MSEFMGLISGSYDAKKEGFVPGGISLHRYPRSYATSNRSIMTAHGPDAHVFESASKAKLEPVKYEASGLAFMFETNKMMRVTRHAMASKALQADYFECWSTLPKRFEATM